MEVLGHHRHVTASERREARGVEIAQGLPVNGHLARISRQESSENVNEGGLSTTGGSPDQGQLPGRHLEVEIPKDTHAAEGLAQALDLHSISSFSGHERD